MARTTLREFLANRKLLAIKISSGDLDGFFRKSFTVPANTTALATFADGSRELLPEGREVTGTFDLVIAKRASIQLRLTFADLRTSDGLPISATCGLAVELAAGTEEYFRDFCRALFSFPGTYAADDLKKHAAPEIRRSVAAYVASRPAEELHRQDHSGPLGEALSACLERFFFDGGVRFQSLVELSLISAEHEKRVATEKSRAEKDRLSAEAQDKKEDRIRRLASILKDQDVQGLLTRVPDERLKGLLYAKLMEDDNVQITAEELISRTKDCGEEVVQVIYKAMESLLSTGASIASDEIETDHAERIFVAAGNKVLELDPETSEPPRVHVFPDPLRSVRLGANRLLGGGKTGIAAIPLEEGGEVLRFPLPEGRSVRGGVNAIASDANWLYATHSEYGLARWRADRPDEEAELLYPEITRPHRTTRSVQAHGNQIIFASGQHVFRAPADGNEPPVKYVSSIESPITCVAAAARTIFAGTENGSIICWKIDGPDQPVVLVRKRDAIVNLQLAKICGIPHLIYSARDLSVRARVIGQNLETSYDTDGQAVGVIDAASDLICASDADGRRLLLWKSTSPSRPSGEIEIWKESRKPVLDVWMKKSLAKSA